MDTWGASANGLEKDRSHAVNGSLVSFLSSRTSNEFRFQYSREDRPRPYSGPTNPLGDTTGVSSIFGAAVPFHDTDVDPLNSFRFGLPFFLPIRDDHDTRVQLLDNVSIARGNHLFKFGGEWNRTATTQVFVGFAGGRMAFTSVHGFENFVNQGSHYIECSNGQSGVYPGFTCPVGTTISGPVILYLQQSGVGTNTVEQAGTQTITQNEFAVYLQDTWKPSDRAGPDHAPFAGVLRAVDRLHGHERQGALHLPIGRHDSVRQEDVAAAAGDRLGPECRRAAGVPRERRHLLRSYPGA